MMPDDLAEKIAGRSRRKTSAREKYLVLISGAVTFGLLIPLILILIGHLLDHLLSLPRFAWSVILIGFLFIPLGLLFIAWSVYIQYRVGRGTPLPIAPTQKLVINGPYKYCRNPMIFGALLYYTGLAIIFNSFSMLFILIPLLFIPILIYVKLIEEKELEIRFGEEYTEYRKRTSFLIPFRIKD
ncbi:hypothetical protein DRO97_10400 [Archaeoglobales archaeon]|nr:MAG: hypothetical protein DRO97_10400 [Archaeoglobales archaeon]